MSEAKLLAENELLRAFIKQMLLDGIKRMDCRECHTCDHHLATVEAICNEFNGRFVPP